MLVSSSWLQPFHRIADSIRRSSLQARLTVGVVVVSAFALGSVAWWTGWRMQQILVDARKRNIRYVAERFGRAVEHYSQGKPAANGLQPAIDSLSAEDVFLWVKANDGQTIALSMVLEGRTDERGALLDRISLQPVMPKVYVAGDRHYVLCSGVLEVKGTDLGLLYVAQDITSDREMLIAVWRGLALASILALVAIAPVTATFVGKSLAPLQYLRELADALAKGERQRAELSLDAAPKEVRELARACEAMMLKISQNCEQHRQFVGNVSHELRTPLTIVRGYLQSTLRRSQNLTESQKEALGIAAGEAERTVQLLQDLLDLARADGGHFHFHVEPIALNDTISEVATMARQYGNRRVTALEEIDNVWVRADLQRLKQVLLNLVDNAVKYSDAEQPVELSAVKNDSWGIIEVRDRGVGIPLAQQARIFDRFYRADEARSHTTGGTGLGLSIVKTLVEGMGGQVSVRSKVREGSTFIVALPLVR